MDKDPIERERRFRQTIEWSTATWQIEGSPRRPPSRRLSKVLALTVLLLAFGGLFLFIFGLSVKWTDVYACSLAEARRTPAVIAALGEPIEAGFFAWIYGYSQEGSVTNAAFRTTLAGPKGEGTLRVQWYSSPVGSSLLMELDQNGQTSRVYSGPVTCR